MKYAKEHDKEKVLLIIDEINRANLSNVLGPIFYLFEHKMDKSNVEIEISPGFKINKLPDNFSVIATMNTADRSLAVVDFALRRRFAWYTLKPKAIKSNQFFKEDFARLRGALFTLLLPLLFTFLNFCCYFRFYSLACPERDARGLAGDGHGRHFVV